MKEELADMHKLRTWAEIDLDALLQNYKVAAGLGKRVMCVVKADAYGHGAVKISRFLESRGAFAFAVACLSEALELRFGEIVAPILILGYSDTRCVPMLLQNNISQTVADEKAAIALSNAAEEQGGILHVHIKIDTGMNRLGIMAQNSGQVNEAIQTVLRIAKLPYLEIEGIYTHLAAADVPEEISYTNLQIDRFAKVVRGVRQSGVNVPVCHAHNSAGILMHSSTQFDMVRAGIMLYGMYPDSSPRSGGPLRPVMALKTRIAQVKEIPIGTTVSYGRMYTAGSCKRIAVLSAGYADGFPRRLSSHTAVVTGGHWCPQIGRICMDMCMADITGVPDAKRGDEVILFGSGGKSIEEIAQTTGTINYEISCLVTKRVPRIYIGGILP